MTHKLAVIGRNIAMGMDASVGTEAMKARIN